MFRIKKKLEKNFKSQNKLINDNFQKFNEQMTKNFNQIEVNKDTKIDKIYAEMACLKFVQDKKLSNEQLNNDKLQVDRIIDSVNDINNDINKKIRKI